MYKQVPPHCCLTDLKRKNKHKLQESPKFALFIHDTKKYFFFKKKDAGYDSNLLSIVFHCTYKT